MPSEVAAFEVTLGCENCGESWNRQYPARTDVVEDGRVKSFNKDCEKMGTVGCDCCEVLRCPTCDLLDNVTVEDRSPIEEVDDD